MLGSPHICPHVLLMRGGVVAFADTRKGFLVCGAALDDPAFTLCYSASQRSYRQRVGVAGQRILEGDTHTHTQRLQDRLACLGFPLVAGRWCWRLAARSCGSSWNRRFWKSVACLASIGLLVGKDQRERIATRSPNRPNQLNPELFNPIKIRLPKLSCTSRTRSNGATAGRQAANQTINQ